MHLCCIFNYSRRNGKKTEKSMKYLFQNLKHIAIPYGPTEASPVITITKKKSMPDLYKRSTVGSAIGHAELKIVNPHTGELLPRGESDELWTRRIYVLPDYWNQIDATTEAKDDHGWYKIEWVVTSLILLDIMDANSRQSSTI